MKQSYIRSIPLRCVVCGSADDFEYNEDKTYIKCKKCNKEYPGGYDELVELNQVGIQAEIDAMQVEVKNYLEKDLCETFKKTYKGCKNVKVK